jgi:hypothetical protein
MAHEIESRIADVRRRARRLLLLYALSWIVAAVVAAILVLGLADYWIRFRDPGIRILSLLAVMAAGGWAAFRYLRPLLTRRLDDVAIAQRIERHFPVLHDRLSSSVEFLKTSPSDREVGSPALRELVIAQTAAAVKDLNLANVLERRPTQRALAGAVTVILLAATAVLLDPGAARLALARLVNPLATVDWPRQSELIFRHSPDRIAKGQTFEVELVDGHDRPLPDDVRIHYRYETGGDEIEEIEAMHPLAGVMVARKENVTRPFSYRAEGGDDDTMAWRKLDVVEAPRIDSLQATLYPPAYTEWPAEPAENNFSALRGTRVAFSGSATAPLRSVILRRDAQPPIPCAVSPDGRRFELAADAPEPLVVDKSGQYWFELEDTTGLIGGQESRWEIHAVPDSPPSVTIERPGANAYVTPSAVVQLRCVAKDDLEVRNISLHFQPSIIVAPPATGEADQPADVAPEEAAKQSEPDERNVSLVDGPVLDADGKRSIKGNASLAGGLPNESLTEEYQWSLRDLGLQPGSQVTFFVSATDSAGQIGRSPERRLIVITPEELADRLAQRQEAILAELVRVLKMEHDAQGQIARLSIQLGEVRHLAKADIDHAQATELTQRQIARTLSDRNDGVPAQIDDLLNDLASNQIESDEIGRRMQAILSTLESLESEHLTPAEHRLTFAVKAAQADLADATAAGKADFQQSESVAPALAEVDLHQQAVIRALEEMLSELGQWDSYRRFARDIAQLVHDQTELEQATKQLGLRLLGKQLKDLDPQQQADLKKLANRQAELSRGFDKLLSAMDHTSRKLEADDPSGGARLADALDLAKSQGTAGRMRAAGESLSRNQLGQAAGAEAQVRHDLAEMLDLLTGRREHELERLVEKLRQAEGQLAALRAAHQTLREQLAKALEKPAADRTADERAEIAQLLRKQQALQEEIERLGRKLTQLQADAAGRTAEKAAKEIERESSDAKADDRAGADQQAQKAQEDLAKAQRQLAQSRREAESQLARQQIARLEQALHSFQQRQTQILEETKRLDGQAGAEAAQALAQDERNLETETHQQADKLTAAEVFRLALSRAARDMARAADDLDRGKTGQPTQQAEQDALLAIGRLIDALKAATPKPGGEAGGDGGKGSSGGDPSKLAELKLLKLMQEDLNSRYQDLRKSDPKPQSDGALAELATEQGRLAELALKLAEQSEQEADENDQSEPEPGLQPPVAPQDDPLGRQEAPI